MPAYDSYPVVSVIQSTDVVLFHQASSDAERLISFTDMETSILDALPVFALDAIDPILVTDVLLANRAGVNSKVTMQVLADSMADVIVSTIPVATASANGLMSSTDKTIFDTRTSNATASALVIRDGSGGAAFDTITITGGTVTGTPTASTDIVTKGYVDATAAGLTIKSPAAAATTANVATLAGGAPSTVDGHALSVNDRVLVKDQSTPSQNGIYIVQTVGSGSNGTWVRSSDADTGAELPTGSYIFVTNGTANSSSSWVMTTQGTIVIGVTSIVWTLYTQITNILASNIIGQLVQAQIADAAISTAKFASGITPVEILGALPGSGNFEGRQVYLTTDNKLYRYDGSAFTVATAATDITGTLVAGQIAAGAINTTQLAAGAVIASKIASGTITTTQIASLTILAANIAAGTITADKLTVSSLSAISANIGTVTSGTAGGWTLTSTKITSTASSSTLELDSTVPWIKANKSSTFATFGAFDPGTGSVGFFDIAEGLAVQVRLRGGLGNNFAAGGGSLQICNLAGTTTAIITGSSGNAGFSGTLSVTGSSTLSGATINGGGRTVTTLQNLKLDLTSAGANRCDIGCGEVSGAACGSLVTYINIYLNGRSVWIPFTATTP